jgi:hypothetical protein
MNCWQRLGLEEGKVNESEVRKAYAKLLKKIRPDRDPEGFQLLRQAYEEALQSLKTVEEQKDPGEKELIEVKKEGLADQEKELYDWLGQSIEGMPAEILTALVEADLVETWMGMKQTADQGDFLAFKLLTDLYFKKALEHNNDFVLLWHAVRFYYLAEGMHSELIPTEYLMKDLEQGRSGWNSALYMEEEQLNAVHGMRYASALIYHFPNHANEEYAIFIYQLARRIALISPRKAQRLENLAYPYLRTELKHQHDLSDWISIGKNLLVLDLKEVQRWQVEFERAPLERKWNHPELAAELYKLDQHFKRLEQMNKIIYFNFEMIFELLDHPENFSLRKAYRKMKWESIFFNRWRKKLRLTSSQSNE